MKESIYKSSGNLLSDDSLYNTLGKLMVILLNFEKTHLRDNSNDLLIHSKSNFLLYSPFITPLEVNGRRNPAFYFTCTNGIYFQENCLYHEDSLR